MSCYLSYANDAGNGYESRRLSNRDRAVSVRAVWPVKRGRFRGSPDTRSLRCYRVSCRLQKSPTCDFCKALPYASSGLRNEQKPRTLHSPLSERQLELRLKEIDRKLQAYDERKTLHPPKKTWHHWEPAQLRKSKTWNKKASSRQQPVSMVKAKEQIAKLAVKLKVYMDNVRDSQGSPTSKVSLPTQ